MKRKKNLYKKITDLDTIINMYDKTVRLNTRNKKKIEEFDDFYSENLVSIKDVLASKKYVPRKYSIFFIREPKLRVIMSQSIKDKIVNHLVAKYILIESFDDILIDSNCATRKGKGTHYAINLFKKYLNEMKMKCEKFYVLKFDISKYFYNISHDIVREIIKKRIKDKDAIKILDNIISSTNLPYVNEEINHLKQINKKNLEIDKIPLYEKNKGFPIGNMTSQIIACIYLNDLDHFIKEKLKIKRYIRYMDDGILVCADKNHLRYSLNQIRNFLKKYNLELNSKTKIYKSTESIEFLGFNFLIKDKIILKVRKQTKKRFKYKLKKLSKLCKENKVTKNDIINIKNSYIAHLKHGNCTNLINKNVKKLDRIINKY